MGCDPSKNNMEIYKAGKEFINDPAVKALFKNPSDLVYKKYIQMFGFKPSEWKVFQPTKTDIKKFKGEMKYLLKHIKRGKIGGIGAANMYTTSGVVRRNPILAGLYDNFLTINHQMKGRQITNGQEFTKILNSLATESILTGMLPNSRSFKKAQKRLRKIEDSIEKLSIDEQNGVEGASQKRVAREAELDQLLSTGEGKIFKDFVNLIENKDTGLRSVKSVIDITKDRQGKNLTDKNIKDIKKAILNSGITDSPNMQNALVDYIDMMHTLYSTLHHGVDAYVGAIEQGMLAKGEKDFSRIDNMKTKLLDKLLPDEKAGYYPHFRYDLNVEFLDGLMPKLQKLSSDSAFGSQQGIKESVDSVDLFEAAVGDINTYLSKRIKPRTKNLDNKLYSMNFPVVMKRYTDEINRFNFVSHTQKYTRQALNEARKAFKEGKDLEGYGAQFVEMIKDLNNAQLGTKEINSGEFKHISRAILNLEFVSKLGLNVRSAARNSTQALLNFVEFGPRMMIKSRNFYLNNKEIREAVEKAMEESGVKFEEAPQELIESGGTKKIFSERVRFTEGGEIEFKNPSYLSGFADLTSVAAQKTGFMMRDVENFNRKTTYKFGFYKMYHDLTTNPAYRELVLKQFKDRGQDMSSAQFDLEVYKRSKNYAERMVTLLHFDYSSVSKSKLMRTKVGRFMFQFQHYAHKFAEYNFKVGREAKHQIMAREFKANGEVGKALRMGMAYYAVPALLSALTQNDWFRMIQHDSSQRIAQWWDFFTGDEEDFEKATYGRGAIGAMIGFPAFSDFLALGEVAELWDLDDNEWLEMALGYNDMSNASGDAKIRKLFNIANIQLARTFYTTSDIAFDGSPGTAAAFELGIYPTARAKRLRERAISAASVVLPDRVLESLDYIDQHRGRAREKEKQKRSVGYAR